MYRTINFLLCLLSLAFSFSSLFQQNAWARYCDRATFSCSTKREAVFLVDPTTGARSIISSSLEGAPVGGGPSLSDPMALAVDALGNIYVTGGQSNGSVVYIDQATGNRTLVSSNSHGSGPQFQYPTGIAKDVQGNLIVSDLDTTNFLVNRLLRVDHSTGDRTVLSGRMTRVPSVSIGVGPAFDTPFDVVVDSLGELYTLDLGPYAGTEGQWAIVRIDRATGDRVVVADNTGSGIGHRFTPYSIAHKAADGFFMSGGLHNFVQFVDEATNSRDNRGGPYIGGVSPQTVLMPYGLAWT